MSPESGLDMSGVLKKLEILTKPEETEVKPSGQVETHNPFPIAVFGPAVEGNTTNVETALKAESLIQIDPKNPAQTGDLISDAFNRPDMLELLHA